MSQIEERLGELAKLIQSKQDADALRAHLDQVLGGAAFSSSRRSAQFLQYVVEKAIAQEIDSLKERTIGVEVFHRPPDYDTGEDAIVRVTASDVRRRLTQHYSREGLGSEFRISLPPGGYVPEVFRDLPITYAVSLFPKVAETGRSAGPETNAEVSEPLAPVRQPDRLPEPRRVVPLSLVAVVSLLLAGALLWGSHRRSPVDVQQPWSYLFASGQPVPVILADPDLNEIQKLTGRYVSLSEYANGKLGCETLAPALESVCRIALRGDKVASVDANALARLAGVAAQFHAGVEPRAARDVRLPEVQGLSDVIILGSRTANPWTDLYRDKVDFFIEYDSHSGLRVVRNVHPRQGEPAVYVPTAGPYGTGDNYSLVSFVKSLNGKGHALLLAGGTHEGMDAAVNMVTNESHMQEALRQCGAQTAGTSFQLLLKLKMMAGSSLTAEPLICHRL